MANEKSVQETIQDITMIRRLIDRTSNKEDAAPATVTAINAGVAVQTISLVIALGLIGLEVGTNASMTSTMLLARTERDLGTMGLGFAAAILGAVLLCLHFIIWRSARRDDSNFAEFVGRNFRYLKNLSFLTDLITKAASLALVVLSGKTEWVTPLCVLFVGSYLIEGKFFHLSIRTSLCLGAITVAGAGALFALHATSLLYPLGIFSTCTALSIAYLYRTKVGFADVSK